MSGPAKTVYWTINKGIQKISLSTNTISVTRGSTSTITATWLGDGTLSATSSNTSVATVSVSGGVITVTGVASGGVGITVSVSEGTKYFAGTASVTATVSNYDALPIPTQSGTLTYNGSAQSPSWNNYDYSKMTFGGTMTGTYPGTYQAKFTLEPGYEWVDGTTSVKNVSWTINKATPTLAISPPSIDVMVGQMQYFDVTWPFSGVLTASVSDSSVASAVLSGGSSYLNVRGLSAGSVSITLTLTSSTLYNNASITISGYVQSKPSANLQLSQTSVAVTPGGRATITATRNGTGAISAVSSDPSIASVSVSGTTIKITGVSQGNVSITAYVAETTAYAAGSANAYGTVYSSDTVLVTSRVYKSVDEPMDITVIYSDGNSGGNFIERKISSGVPTVLDVQPHGILVLSLENGIPLEIDDGYSTGDYTLLSKGRGVRNGYYVNALTEYIINSGGTYYIS